VNRNPPFSFLLKQNRPGYASDFVFLTSADNPANPPCNSRRVRWPHPLRDLPALLPLHHGDVVLALQVEPELRAVAEIAAEPHGGVGGDRAAAVQDVGDPAGRHADVERQPVGRQPARGEFRLSRRPGWKIARFMAQP